MRIRNPGKKDTHPSLTIEEPVEDVEVVVVDGVVKGEDDHLGRVLWGQVTRDLGRGR